MSGSKTLFLAERKKKMESLLVRHGMSVVVTSTRIRSSWTATTTILRSVELLLSVDLGVASGRFSSPDFHVGAGNANRAEVRGRTLVG